MDIKGTALSKLRWNKESNLSDAKEYIDKCHISFENCNLEENLDDVHLLLSLWEIIKNDARYNSLVKEFITLEHKVKEFEYIRQLDRYICEHIEYLWDSYNMYNIEHVRPDQYVETNKYSSGIYTTIGLNRHFMMDYLPLKYMVDRRLKFSNVTTQKSLLFRWISGLNTYIGVQERHRDNDYCFPSFKKYLNDEISKAKSFLSLLETRYNIVDNIYTFYSISKQDECTFLWNPNDDEGLDILFNYLTENQKIDCEKTYFEMLFSGCSLGDIENPIIWLDRREIGNKVNTKSLVDLVNYLFEKNYIEPNTIHDKITIIKHVFLDANQEMTNTLRGSSNPDSTFIKDLKKTLPGN